MAEDKIGDFINLEAVQAVKDLVTYIPKLAEETVKFIQVSKNLATQIENVNTKENTSANNKKKLTTLEQEAIRITKATDKAKAKLTLTEQGAANALIGTRTELSKVGKLTKAQIVANKALAGSYDKISAELTLNLVKYKQLSKVEREVGEEGRKLAEVINKQRAELKRLDAGIGNNVRNVGNYKSALDGVNRSAIGFGSTSKTLRHTLSGLLGAFGVTAGIVGFIGVLKDGVKTMFQFETGVKNVLTLLSQSEKIKFKPIFEQGSIELQKKYGLAQADVNKALFDAVSAGVQAKDAIKFLSQSAELAIGGVTSLENAVDGVTSVLNAYKLGAEETSKVTSAFFSAQKFGKTTVAELTNEIGRVIPTAKAAGISYQEVLALFAELTRQGLKTTDSTTAIRQSIAALIKPSKQAKKVFEELGIETGAVAVQNNGLLGTLLLIADAAKENGDSLAQIIPNIRALTGISALGTEALREYDVFLKTITEDYGEGSSLANAYETQMESLQNRYNRLAATIRTGFVSALSSTVEFISKNSRAFTNLIKGITLAITAYATYRITLGLVAIAQRLNIVGMVKTIKYLGIQTAATNIASSALASLRAALATATGGISLVVAALTTAAATFLLFRDNTDEATESQKKLNKELEKVNASITQANYNKFLQDIGAIKTEFITLADGTKVAVPAIQNAESILENFAKKADSLSANELLNFSKFFRDELANALLVLEGLKEGTLEFDLQKDVINKYTSSLEIVNRRLTDFDRIRAGLKKKGAKESIDKDIEALIALDEALADNQASIEYNKLMNSVIDTADGAALSIKKSAAQIEEEFETMFAAAADKELGDRLDEEYEAVIDNQKRIIDEERRAAEIRKRIQEELEAAKLDLAAEAVDALADIANSIIEAQIDRIERQKEIQIEALEEENTRESRAIDDRVRQGLITEESAAVQKEYLDRRIEDERAAIEKEAEKRKEKAAKRQAAIEAAAAVAGIAIEAAKGIAIANAQAPATFGLSLSWIPFIIASAALQTGVVLANKIPQFATGTESSPDTFIAGEKGVELMKTKSGDTILTPDAPTLYSGMAGTKIYNNTDTLRMLGDVNTNPQNNRDIIDTIKDGDSKIIKAIKRNKHNIVLNNNGVDSRIPGYNNRRFI